MIFKRKEEFFKKLGEQFSETDIIELLEAGKMSLERKSVVIDLDMSDSRAWELIGKAEKFLNNM